MWFSRLFKGRDKSSDGGAKEEATVDQGMHYVYVIILLQVLFVFGIAAVIMVVGTVMATPLWVFLLAFGLAAWGCVFIYRKAREQFRKLHKTFSQVNLSNRNYEISVMGGALRMRVEQSAQQQLLEAPAPAVIDAETIETSAQ